jgi:hypothetical protein
MRSTLPDLGHDLNPAFPIAARAPKRLAFERELGDE